MKDHLVKKFRIVTISLVFSGALNIGLVAAFAAFAAQREPAFVLGVRKESSDECKISNVAALEAMSKRSFRELVALLTNHELVEAGYAKRDLALSVLVARHYFHLERALSTSQLQKRSIQIEPGYSIELYPALTDEQFDAIIRFAYQEKWPLTSQGLFALMKKSASARDETLNLAFLHTPEMYALQALFPKSDPALLLTLVVEGNWELLDRFAKEQAQMLDLSAEKRRSLLLGYLAHRSPTAAAFLVQTDSAFVLKRFDDRGILDLLALIQEKSIEAEQFCLSLLQSPRSDAVWRTALAKLYSFAGETLPEGADLHAAAARFSTAPRAPAAEEVKIAAQQEDKSPVRFHTVAEGESLWKIARQYKVKVDDIVQLNDIEGNRLYPGMTIQLP